jgi:two-component SAPR family response regulator
MVRLLGPVEVMSADLRTVAFERSKALELVVWLTQHRDRSTRTGARTALWESNVRDATFANVVSDARRNLARLEPPADGEEWVGRTLTEELPLHAAVVTDADLLNDRLRACRGLAPEDAIAVLRPALSLIRDMPFSGTSYLWPDSEGITSQLTLLATSAATVLAGHYLTMGDTDGVFWSTGQGLKVLPGHEELIALRMRAHGRQGDLAGVRREWESYERVLHAEAWSDGEPSPKLVALRRELLSLR